MSAEEAEEEDERPPRDVGCPVTEAAAAASTESRRQFAGEETEEGKVSASSAAVERAAPNANDGRRKIADDAASRSGDICRICHMGGFPAVVGYRPVWEWPDPGPRGRDSRTSTLSSYAYLGGLISACRCRGTVGLVHTECLERWLTESGHTRCELCGHAYSTKRVPRHGVLSSLVIWFNTVIATRQMLLDLLYLAATTPLALFSCYVCALALKMIVESGFQDIPWMIVAMLPTCSLTLVAYWGWFVTLGRLHARRWQRFWRNNFVVRLIPDSANFRHRDDTLTDTLVRQTNNEQNDFYLR